VTALKKNNKLQSRARSWSAQELGICSYRFFAIFRYRNSVLLFNCVCEGYRLWRLRKT